MSRLTQNQIDHIRSLHERNYSGNRIAEELTLTPSLVYYYIKKFKEEKTEEEAPPEIPSEDQDKSPGEEAYDPEQWVEFWKGKYLEAHALLVENGIV